MQSSRRSSARNKSSFRVGEQQALPSSLSSFSDKQTFGGPTTLTSFGNVHSSKDDNDAFESGSYPPKAAKLSKLSTVKSSRRRKKAKAPTKNNTKDERKLDELDLMICHEEFPNLVALSEKVKAMKQKLSTNAAQIYEQNRPKPVKSALQPGEVLETVELMKEQHSVKGTEIKRGAYPLTDVSQLEIQ
jgi:hypothetical protein